MGRKKTDGEAIDVVVPAGEAVEKGELYRIDNFTGFALDDIDTAEVDRAVALNRNQDVWKCKTPAGVGVTRGAFVKWTDTAGAFQQGDTDLVNEASPLVATGNSVAQVEEVRNSDGYAALKLLI